MLFGVPDEIMDVTRVSGMVRKRRLIYRMTSFDYRKVFRHSRECTGSDEWVLDLHREGGPPTREGPRTLGVAHQVGGVSPRLSCAREKEKPKEEKENKGKGGKEEKDSTFQS